MIWPQLQAALAGMLLHSLWEGAAVALVLALVLFLVRSSRARYGAACLAMVVLLSGLVVTFTHLVPTQPGPARVAGSGWIPGAARVFREALLPVPKRESPSFDYRMWVVPIWLAGVFAFYLRGLASWMAARRLRRVGVCSVTEVWRARVDALRGRLFLSRPVVLLESSLAEVPVVIGYFRPLILMPVGLLAGLPTAQVEAILLHELAHIRRYDYLVNLLQVFVEGLLFYHPAVWWISGTMRTERENCCDDVVVAVTGGGHELASALTALEQRRGFPQEAMAATGGSLVSRIQRLLGGRERRFATAMPGLTAGLMAAIFAVAAVSARPVVQAAVVATPLAWVAPWPVAPQILLAQAVPPTVVPPPVAQPPVAQPAAPVSTPSLPDRRIVPNDLLSISVFDQPSLSLRARVKADGTVEMPFVKGLRAQGLLPRELEIEIVRALVDQHILTEPVVTVSIAEYGARQISVVGDVKIPGQFNIVAPITLLEALAKAGWTTTDAGAEVLLSRSASEAPRKISIDELQKNSLDLTINVVLTGGEVINVPEAPKIWVTGSVAHPQAIPIRKPGDATVLRVVASVQGLTQYYSKVAYIYRADPSDGGRRHEIQVPLKEIMHRQAQDVPLLADDILLMPDESGIFRRQLLQKLQQQYYDPKPPTVPEWLSK